MSRRIVVFLVFALFLANITLANSIGGINGSYNTVTQIIYINGFESTVLPEIKELLPTFTSLVYSNASNYRNYSNYKSQQTEGYLVITDSTAANFQLSPVPRSEYNNSGQHWAFDIVTDEVMYFYEIITDPWGVEWYHVVYDNQKTRTVKYPEYKIQGQDGYIHHNLVNVIRWK